MMKRWMPLFLCLAAAFPAPAQEYYATIREDIRSFTMQSLTDGTLTVRRTVEVHSKQGDEAAIFLVYTQQNETLTSFSGEKTTPNGKKESIRKKDLTTTSIASGIAEDGFATYYQPSSVTYPYTVTYKYSVQYKKGFAVFPEFEPVTTEKTALKNGSYTLIVPPGTVIRSYASPAAGTCAFSKGDKDERYEWKIQDYKGYVAEMNMPSWTELVPVVLASPDAFIFDGVAGRQDSWKDVGAWQYQLLDKEETLPAETVGKIRDLTANATSDLEKVRILYRYLKDKTRYVSIQFGIGGFKPFPAATVDKTGFGDCKALSNYMLRLLEACGVKAEYTILNTNRRDFRPDYPSFGQSNHVILTVPLKDYADTLFLECTNPTYPIGYRHEDMAGHEMILIGENGGQLVRARAYPDSLKRQEIHSHIHLDADGSARVNVVRNLWTDWIEDWLGFDDMEKEEQRTLMTWAMDVQPQNLTPLAFKDNFDSYDGPGWYPRCSLEYRFDVRTYGQPSDTRMRVAVNPFSKRMTAQRAKRVNPMVFREGAVFVDEITIDLPEGYRIESIPPDMDLDEVWASFKSTASAEGNQVRISQCLRLKPCRLEPEAYAGFRDFTRSMNRSYGAALILKKED